jgi:hypothetical protein
MPAPTADELAAIERRLSAILEPYRSRLESATIYGIPTLRRPGAKRHDWFAFVKPASRHVSFFLLPVHTYPELREGLSPGLARRLTGASTFAFPVLDEGLFAELEGLVARAYERYLAG